MARGAQTCNAVAPPAHPTFPDLPLTTSTVGQFTLQSVSYQLNIQGDIKYVKGWIQFLIQLGSTVPAATGGGGGQLAAQDPTKTPTFSGSDWRFAQASVNTASGNQCSVSGYIFWDGSKWQDVPVSWSDPTNTKLYPIGIWREGSTNKAQFGGTWPANVPAWGDPDNAKSSSVLPQWVSTIQTDWSNVYDLKRQDCPSTDDSCCRYHIKVVVSFNEVAAVSGPTVIVLAANDARSNAGAWSMLDTRANMPAHEFGHHLGYPDEYVGGVGVDASVNGDGAVKGIDPDSLMGQNLTVVKARHFRVICAQLSTMVDTASAKSNGYVFKAVA